MFEDKVVIITGASAGIGAQTALDVSKLGASLIITGRNKENLDHIAKECSAISTKKLLPLSVIADITKESDIEKLMKTTIEIYGKLDVLVNNAGIYYSDTIETTSLDLYDLTMNTNIRGPYYLTTLAVPYLIQSKGCIVNVSSVAGLRPFPGALAYCISKAALDQFTKCVALELAPKGVRINAVSPGAIKTEIHMKSGLSEEKYQAFQEECKVTHAIGRMGEVEEVSSAIIFLASDAASNITGVTLPVDGGRHAMCPR